MYDMHTHFIPPELLTWIRDHQKTIDATWERKSPKQNEFLTINGKWGFELKESFVNPIKYLKEQAQAGVEHSLISPIPQLFMYEFSSGITSEMVHVYNQSLADWSRQHPEHISALATVCLQDPVQAAEDLRSAMNDGLKGAIIGPGLSGKLLTNECFIPFWEEANTQRAIVFIHPLLSEDPRLKQRMMPNLIGVPWETTVCATDLLLSGLLDRYPYVKILLAHGGGFLPYQIGRLDKGYEKWQSVSGALQAPPIEYLRRFWFDTVLWNPDTLQYLTTLVGEDRVVPGSDYPFDLCAFPPVALSVLGVQSLLAK
ncbi:amidohydrolase family protein [Aneurinibacillus sp. Ricciae_BoGa-3]|uniref:amidohydrolase family protein n=1 Tax=Aneurinibacillus sp. Ricciae_BoGa-3 TaxID=3022697 RepID=UPI00233FF271|nr:amidohydrolase family protein [Aneurinibacillus sp. Ricciae_BoGa-3]WCK56800.1 amidohydrolase family protein [Aneurinibacillus sp. Ricciae_BoGa-3]